MPEHMLVEYRESHDVLQEDDIAHVRALVRSKAKEIGFSVINQTKIMTAASELLRNMIEYGGGGKVTIDVLRQETKVGMRMSFKDEGPGIGDLNLALQEGWTSGQGLGLGLSGSKKLMDEFVIDSQLGKGTCISVIKWTH